ncbi:hypothetical protein V8F33_005061 [Rhypophila sp. PSN 637]
MTVASCAAFCGQRDFEFFGVEYAHECYCGNELGGAFAPEDECSSYSAPSPSSSVPVIPSPSSPAASPTASSALPSSVPASTTVAAPPSSSSKQLLQAAPPSSSSSVPTPASTSSSASLPISTTSTTTIPTTTAPYCDPTTTWNPESCWASLPKACETLNATTAPGFFLASIPASQCSYSLSAGSATGHASCLTSHRFLAFDANSAYSCLANLPNLYCTTTTASCDPFATPTPALLNGGFESGELSPWVPQVGAGYTNFDFSVNTERPHSGKYSFKLDYRGGNSVYLYLRHPSATFEPGATYELSYWNWASNTDAYLDPQVLLFTGGQRIGWNTYRRAQRANEWYRQSVTFQAPTSFGRFELQWVIVVSSAPSVMYIDDISIVKVATQN